MGGEETWQALVKSFIFKTVLFSLRKQGTSAGVRLERFRESTLFWKTEDGTNTVLKTNGLQ